MRRRGLRITEREAAAFVRGQVANQLFRNLAALAREGDSTF